VSAVICTLNEEKNLARVIPKIPKSVDQVILVDGHSTDGTVRIAREMMPNIVVLTQSGKGKGDALKCGFGASTGDIIVTLDADGSTDPSELNDFIEPLLRGYDFAKGTRLAKGRPPTMALHRWIGNLLIVRFMNLLFRTRFTDMTSGYNALWRECLKPLHFTGEGYEDEPLMYTRAVKAKLKIIEVRCNYGSRVAGESKAPAFRQAWKSLKTILRERLAWDNPDLMDRFEREFLPVEKLVVRILQYLP
jgi:glycosyltransferase involved in cell wall biosynthesis